MLKKYSIIIFSLFLLFSCEDEDAYSRNDNYPSIGVEINGDVLSPTASIKIKYVMSEILDKDIHFKATVGSYNNNDNWKNFIEFDKDINDLVIPAGKTFVEVNLKLKPKVSYRDFLSFSLDAKSVTKGAVKNYDDKYSNVTFSVTDEKIFVKEVKTTITIQDTYKAREEFSFLNLDGSSKTYNSKAIFILDENESGGVKKISMKQNAFGIEPFVRDMTNFFYLGPDGPRDQYESSKPFSESDEFLYYYITVTNKTPWDEVTPLVYSIDDIIRVKPDNSFEFNLAPNINEYANRAVPEAKWLLLKTDENDNQEYRKVWDKFNNGIPFKINYNPMKVVVDKMNSLSSLTDKQDFFNQVVMANSETIPLNLYSAICSFTENNNKFSYNYDKVNKILKVTYFMKCSWMEDEGGQNIVKIESEYKDFDLSKLK